MNNPDDQNRHDAGETDGNMLPFSDDHDKLYSLLHVLRGHEEFTIDLTGIIISSNLEAVNITGYEEWEIIGKHFSLFYTEEDIQNRQPSLDLESSLQTSKIVINSWKLKKRQARFWASMKIIPRYDSLRMLRGYKLIVRDTTHKLLSDFNTQKIRNEYLNLYHNSIFGILRFYLHDGKVTLANGKAMEILGIENLNGFLFRDAFLNEKDFERLVHLVEEKRYTRNVEFQLKHPSGKIWVSMDCKFNTAGGFVEGVLIDVSEKKSQELALQKLTSDLDTFIYHASHDLRSPLMSIVRLLNQLDGHVQTKSVLEYSEMIRDRVGHLDNLLRDLETIAFTKHSEINYERVFIKEEINFMLRELGTDEIRFVADIQDDMVFISDILRVRTIIKNLIANSVRYHDNIGKRPYVRIKVASHADRLELEVKDNGIGIEKEEMEKIYGMFHRGHVTRSGSGLGLYTVRSMVDQLGGAIDLESIIGKGTTVKLELPNKWDSRTPKK